jgi:hypothetical protein
MISELFLKVTGKQEIERFTGILCLGLIEAMQNGSLSLNEASQYFVSPYSAQLLKEKGIDEELESLIHLLCELESVERIIPDKLDSSIKDAKNKFRLFLKSATEPQLPQKYWIEDK